MSVQLWQLLIKLERQDRQRPRIACSECFAILDLLSLGLELGIDLERLEQSALKNLARCPGCREQIQERLRLLEELSA